MRPGFVLKTLPGVALACVGTGAGLAVGRGGIGGEGLAIAIALGWVCFVAAHTFTRSPGWMAIFLAGLSLAVGVLVARLPWLGETKIRWWAAGSALAIMAVAAGLGRALRRRLRPLYGPLWFAAWLLIAGMLVTLLLGVGGEWLRIEAATSLIVFAGLAAARFARFADELPLHGAMDLYLVGINLFLAAGFLRTTPL
jgi:FtsH-binding integral membrane protein